MFKSLLKFFGFCDKDSSCPSKDMSMPYIDQSKMAPYKVEPSMVDPMSDMKLMPDMKNMPKAKTGQVKRFPKKPANKAGSKSPAKPRNTQPKK